jgi:LPS export ABC transporter protein LptC
MARMKCEVAVFCFALLLGCQPAGLISVASDGVPEMDADQVVIGFEHVQTQEGVRQSILVADTAFFWEGADSVVFLNVRMTAFSETGAIRATVTSQRGIQRDHRLVARQSVVLSIPEDSRRIESEELHHDPELERIWSDSATVMYTGEQTVYGSAFQSDLQFSNVTVRDARTGGGS